MQPQHCPIRSLTTMVKQPPLTVCTRVEWPHSGHLPLGSGPSHCMTTSLLPVHFLELGYSQGTTSALRLQRFAKTSGIPTKRNPSGVRQRLTVTYKLPGCPKNLPR